MFQYLIPEQQREMLLGFTIFTDGQDELLAQVGSDDDISKWVLEVDVVDADQTNLIMTTFLHEYAHLMTLEKEQMDMDKDVLFADDNYEIHVTAAACKTYFVEGMGCVKGNSYLHHFYEQFWLHIIDEWREREIVTDEDEAELFYEDFEDEFVMDYAVTSPDEDIAEAWTYFILFPKPEGNKIWEQKIAFFYEYPEKVKLRAEILSRLLSYLSRMNG